MYVHWRKDGESVEMLHVHHLQQTGSAISDLG